VEDNSHAGQGAVLLDIGGDIGALVVTMPKSMEGIEVEIRPVGAGGDAGGSRPGSDHDEADDEPSHDHVHGQHEHAHDELVHAHEHDDQTHDDHEPDHEHTHEHAHGASPWPHVAVVARPAPAGIVYSLVYPQLREGSYELYERPHGPVELTVEITGGYVADAVWPS
jgi:hypothetical protein